MSVPKIASRPRVGRIARYISRSRLVLPAPDGPSSQRNAPSGSAKLRSCSTSGPACGMRALAGTAIAEPDSVESNHRRHSCHSARRAAIASRLTLPHHWPDMRITCPTCSAAYDVPDSLMTAGRVVRCARCGGNWTPVAAAPVTEPSRRRLEPPPDRTSGRPGAAGGRVPQHRCWRAPSAMDRLAAHARPRCRRRRPGCGWPGRAASWCSFWRSALPLRGAARSSQRGRRVPAPTPSSASSHGRKPADDRHRRCRRRARGRLARRGAAPAAGGVRALHPGQPRRPDRAGGSGRRQPGRTRRGGHARRIDRARRRA